MANLESVQIAPTSRVLSALTDDASAIPAYVDKELRFNSMAMLIWIQSIDANQETALYQMEKTTKAQDAARKWRELKNEVDNLITELSKPDKKPDATIGISTGLRTSLIEEDVDYMGHSSRQGLPSEFNVGQLRSLSTAIDTHISGYTDMSPKNQIETQKAITNVQTVVQAATGQVSQNARQLQEIVSNSYR